MQRLGSLASLALAGALAVSMAAAEGRTNDVQGQGRPDDGSTAEIAPAEAHAIAVEAYVYGYPLVMMEMTRRERTNVAQPVDGRAPMGQLARVRTVASPGPQELTVPSAEALGTTAWVDLSAEPYVLSIPSIQGRYYLMPIVDAWTTIVASIGSRTTGNKPQRYVITGPRWTGGALPRGATRIQSPTDLVWIRGLIHSDGTPGDLDAVHTIQDRIALVPLSAYSKPYAPPPGPIDPAVAMNAPVRAQVDALDAATFFGTMAGLMSENPPVQEDGPLLRRMARIGLYPGRPFDRSGLTQDVVQAIESAPAEARTRVLEAAGTGLDHANDWLVRLRAGRYGTDYLHRAAVAATELGANLPQDEAYAFVTQDARGEPLNGAHKYVLRMEVRRLPPGYGFWSLTLVSARGDGAPPPLRRYAIGGDNRLLANDGGTIDLLIQTASPGPDREANWLPAPDGRFVLELRLYWPTEKPPSILDGTWAPPPVIRADARN